MNWHPFIIAPSGLRAEAPRALTTLEGIGDRLRSAAFAEIQAREAFLWAASFFDDAPQALKLAWIELAQAEDKHLQWLLERMKELQINITERIVSDQLWISLTSCKTAQEFALYMASAEERGRKAGIKFHQALIKIDPISAELFQKIADEEASHIALAYQFYPGPSIAYMGPVEQGSTRGPKV